MNRRFVVVLALVATLAVLSGCNDTHAGSLVLESPDDEAVADESIHETLTLSEATLREDLAIVAAAENGSARYTGTGPPSLATTKSPIEVNGRYYDVSYEVVDEWDGYEPTGHVDYNASELPERRVRFENLSEQDRQGLKPYLEHQDVFTLRPGYDAGFSFPYTPAEWNDSVLFASDDVTGVVYEGEVYPVRPFRPERNRYRTIRITATEVGDGREAYADLVRDRYAFAFSDLSRAERSVLDSAVGEYYYAESTDDEAFDSLVAKFRRHEPIGRDPGTGTWLVRYDGELYLARLHYGPFVTPN